MTDTQAAPPLSEHPPKTGHQFFDYQADAAQYQRLLAARRFIVEGWTRKAFCRDGRVCALGALNKAYTGDPRKGNRLVDDTRSLLEQSLSEYSLNSLVFFNDKIAKTKRDVLRVFDAAIANLKEKWS